VNVTTDKGDATGAHLGDTPAGTLLVRGGASDLILTGAELSGQLYQADFTDVQPKVQARHGTVTVAYPRALPHPLGGNRGSGRIALNDAVPWTVRVTGGLQGGQFQLSSLGLSDLSVDGGARDVEVKLSYPAGIVPLKFGGGLERLVIRRPIGCALTLHVEGGAAQLRVDGQPIAKTQRYSTDVRGNDARSGGYRIELIGGGRDIDIDCYSLLRAQ
jgi:hypothetical protein